MQTQTTELVQCRLILSIEKTQGLWGVEARRGPDQESGPIRSTLHTDEYFKLRRVTLIQSRVTKKR